MKRITKRMEQAVQCYLNRQDRTEHPSGEFGNGNKWYPDESEKCECCDCIRSPSWRYPYSLMKHCRSIGHVANLYGVDVKELRKRVKTASN